MFAEFGPAPLCLELDFDSFDGPPLWVARFRRMSGWLMVAKATIQSEHDLLTAKLVAACDEQENPIPAFKALNLLHCDWFNPTYCDELPPEVLDELICEQEGELVRRWHREKNTGLAEAFEAQEQRIAELEGKVRSAVRRNERRIAELRQRRRHPEATPEMKAAFATIIGDLTDESDELVAEMSATRDAIRAEAEVAEEALWSREDLLIEIEPLHLVRWSARLKTQRDTKRDLPPIAFHVREYGPAQTKVKASDQPEEPAVPPSKRGVASPDTIAAWTKTFGSLDVRDDRTRKPHPLDRYWTDDRLATCKRMWNQGHPAIRIAAVLRGISADQVEGKAVELNFARPPRATPVGYGVAKTAIGFKKPEPSLGLARSDAELFPTPRQNFGAIDPLTIRRKLKRHTVDSPSRRQLLELLAQTELSISTRCADQLAPTATATPGNALSRATTREVEPLALPKGTSEAMAKLQPLLAPLALRNLNAERDKLRRELSAVMIRGQKYFEGSKKYNRNREQRAELEANIAALDRKIEMAEQRHEGTA